MIHETKRRVRSVRLLKTSDGLDERRKAGVQIALLHFHPSKTSLPAQQPATLGNIRPACILASMETILPLPHTSNHASTFAARFADFKMSLANEALTGFQKGQAYDQNRPSYLPEVVDKLLRVLHISGVAGAEVLDLAAGTGKFTELLAKQDEQFQITAVEPHDDMRNELGRKHLANVNVLNGLATKIPLPDEGVDAVVIAQVRFQIIITMLFACCHLLASSPRFLFFQCNCLGREKLLVQRKRSRSSDTVSSTFLVTWKSESLARPLKHPDG
jgi:Methyltransferase domain